MSKRDFFNFIHKRQNVFVNKEVLKKEPPWTNDKILQEYHFCNIHREFDSGTRFYIENIDANSKDLMLRTIIYRILNRPNSYKHIEGHIDGKETDIENIVFSLNTYDGKVFSTAYRIGGPNWSKYDGKIEQMFYGTIRDDIMRNYDMYVDSVMFTETLEDAHNVLCSIRGIGSFFAYEVITDLIYKWYNFTEDDFVAVGPGAKGGLKRIYDNPEDYHSLIYELQDEQSEYLPNNFWLPPHKDHLTLRDIEHSLCEYNKYRKAIEGEGRVRKFECINN